MASLFAENVHEKSRCRLRTYVINMLQSALSGVSSVTVIYNVQLLEA